MHLYIPYGDALPDAFLIQNVPNPSSSSFIFYSLKLSKSQNLFQSLLKSQTPSTHVQISTIIIQSIKELTIKLIFDKFLISLYISYYSILECIFVIPGWQVHFCG